MEPRISLITLGVADLERATAFYRDGLGWPTEGVGFAGFALAHNVRSREDVDAALQHAQGAGGNDSLKTNALLQMNSENIEFRTV